MKQSLVAVLIALFCLSCGRADVPDAHSLKPEVAVPPPPSPPNVLEAQAREAALALGPGTCEEDVPKVVVLPMKGFLGWDRHFDRISVHRSAYRSCLVEMVLDSTEIPDPGQGPKRSPYSRGDLAYDLLSELDFISYGECIPSDVMEKVEVSGSRNVYEWLGDPAHRKQAHQCLTTTSPLAADRVTYSSFGKIRIGLSERALARALRAPPVSDTVGPDAQECHYVESKSLPGMTIMIRNGRVARIDVNAVGIATASGAHVGMPERELRSLYRGRLADEPHKYAGPEGRYLTLRSPDGTRGMRFETDGQIVTSFHAGTAEAIQYVEGCQ